MRAFFDYRKLHLENSGWDSFCIALVVFVVYARTLLPGLGFFCDTAVFQFVGKILGTPHATGYPGYILLNHIFVTYFPLGSYAFRANVLSSIFSIGAIVVLHRLLLRLSVCRTTAATVALIFAFTYTLWSQSIIAEVYTLNILFFALTVFLFIRWYQQHSVYDFFIGCYTYALAFGNHLIMITLLPALLFIVWREKKEYYTSIRIIIPLLIIILIGASQYVYLIARCYSPQTPYLEIKISNVQELWFQITGGVFRDFMFNADLRWVAIVQLPLLVRFLFVEYVFLLIPAAIGFIYFRPLTINMFLFIGILGNFFFNLIYHIPDIYIYMLPLYFLMTLYIAVGFEKILPWLKHKLPWWRDSYLFFIPAIFLLWNYPRVDMSHETQDALIAHRILEIVGNESMIVCPDFDYTTYLWYYILTEEGEKERTSVYCSFIDESSSYQVIDYIKHGIKFYLPVQRKWTPEGLKVYLNLANKDWEWDKLYERIPNPSTDMQAYHLSFITRTKTFFEKNGLRVIPVGNNLYRIELSGSDSGIDKFHH